MDELSDKELAAVQQLNADYRQAHFIQKIKHTHALCILADADGPFLMEDRDSAEDGTRATLLPVWSHPRLAETFMQQTELQGFSVKTIALPLFVDKWLPFLQQQQLLMALLPVAGSDFNVLEPAEFCTACSA